MLSNSPNAFPAMLNFIFDLDDTLVATWELFDEAQQTFLREMEKLGFDRDVTARTFVEVDTKNVLRWGP